MRATGQGIEGDGQAAAPGGAVAAAPADDDPFAWLEQIDSPAALDWVKSHNAVTTAWLEADPHFDALRDQIRAILDSRERIPYVRQMGAHYYNFWRDAEHPRGLWRRTTPQSYRGADPQWETVLDLDALAAAEGENWVWKGESSRYPDWDRCLVSLSRGGADAVVVREFDLAARRFVEGGFELPEAKSEVHWIDRDRIFVATDFGAGSLTESGYPRIVKRWRRGEALAQARTVLEGAVEDVAASGYVYRRGAVCRQVLVRNLTFYTSHYWLLDGGPLDGASAEGGLLERIEVPDDAQLGFFGEQLLVRLRSDWLAGGRSYTAGALLAIGLDAFRRGARDFTVLFEPGPRHALESWTATRNHLVFNSLDEVRGRLIECSFGDGRWSTRPVAAPDFGSLGVGAVEADLCDDYFLTHVDFLTPDSLYLAHAGSDARELLRRRAAFFDAAGLQIAQREAVSRDGTRVPYFLVGPRALAADGSHPTLLYGYGGFEVSLKPFYSAGTGKAWLEKGGVFALANIRGGGEFGPRWHEAALKDKRQRAYDDFIAVAEDLVARAVTQPRRLGVMGGSNGGLLVGVMLTQRPDLFGAVVCQVPLLDMRRYNRLLAGASWMGEYGDPDRPEEWAFISRYSPYQHVRAGVAYPSVLFTTSTRDDRVHPGHARKMMARLESLGVKNAWYYENIEGGHAGAADNRQVAFMTALEYTFLRRVLAPHW
jgi:prolyl oligopeptidase